MAYWVAVPANLAVSSTVVLLADDDFLDNAHGRRRAQRQGQFQFAAQLQPRQTADVTRLP